MKSGTPISVTFAGLTLPNGVEHIIDLTSNMVSEGAQWMGESGFDEIWIDGQTATPDRDDITLSGVSFSEIQGIRKISKTFQVSMLQHWGWQDGDRFSYLSNKDKVEIWQVEQTFAAAIAQKNIPKLDELLIEKTKVIFEISNMKREKVDALRHEEFQYIFDSIHTPPPPLNKDDIRYILINPQVVLPKTFAGNDIIDGETYNCALYFAHIGGKWVIIW
jgi:hypothetical protein